MTATNSQPAVIVSDDGAVRTVALNRPAVRNALDTALLRALGGAVSDAEADDAVDVVILTGTDPAFCAGLDLRALAPTGISAAVIGDLDIDPFLALRSMTKPLIGAVNGPAVTGGLELALQCDFLIASERATFADTHARVGALPGGGLTTLLPRSVGLPAALELSLTGRPVDAIEARAIGLVNRVVPHDELLESAREVARQILAAPRSAVRAIKRAYHDAALVTAARGLELEAELFAQWAVPAGDLRGRVDDVISQGARRHHDARRRPEDRR